MRTSGQRNKQVHFLHQSRIVEVSPGSLYQLHIVYSINFEARKVYTFTLSSNFDLREYQTTIHKRFEQGPSRQISNLSQGRTRSADQCHLTELSELS